MKNHWDEEYMCFIRVFQHFMWLNAGDINKSYRQTVKEAGRWFLTKHPKLLNKPPHWYIATSRPSDLLEILDDLLPIKEDK